MNYRTNQPFVGPSAFAHKGGMHVHAVNRVAASYEHIDPAVVGNERRILVSELSGRSNIMAMTTRHNLQHDRELMDKILAQVVSLENAGYQFEAAEASFDLLVQTLRRHVSSPISSGSATTSNVEAGTISHGLQTEATVKLRVGDRRAARSGRRRRPGERAGRRAAKGSGGVISQPGRNAPGRLQSPRDQFRGRHGRRRARGDRKPRRSTTSGAPSASAKT